jgi:tetratricopeptide (TPR) repeat protein
VIYIATAIIVLALAFYMSREPRKRRQSDRRLGYNEAKIKRIAEGLIAKGKIIPAAKLLESIKLQRIAIDTLEQFGFVQEAAQILIRMNRPDRAGVIFTRAGLWAEAAKSFRLAGMPLEVARCERERGDLATAAEYFAKSKHFAEAAKCYFSTKNYLQSARYYLKCGQNKKAKESYSLWLKEYPFDYANITDDEIDILCEFAPDLPPQELQKLLKQQALTLSETLLKYIEQERFNLADSLFSTLNKQEVIDEAQNAFLDDHRSMRILANFLTAVGDNDLAKQLSISIGDKSPSETIALAPLKPKPNPFDQLSFEQREALIQLLHDQTGDVYEHMYKLLTVKKAA